MGAPRLSRPLAHGAEDRAAAPDSQAGYRGAATCHRRRGVAHCRARCLRRSGRQEPVRQRIPGPDGRVLQSDRAVDRQVPPGRCPAADRRLRAGWRRQCGRPRDRHPDRRPATPIPACRERDIAVDDAAGRRRRPGQQGPHRRSDRRRHHRQRKPATDLRQGSLRTGRPRRRRRHRALRRHRDGQRPDHRNHRSETCS